MYARSFQDEHRHFLAVEIWPIEWKGSADSTHPKEDQMFRFIFVLVAMCAMLHAAEEKPKLPVEVIQMVASYDAEVAKLKSTYDAEVLKRAEVLKGKLVKAQEVVTKKGDLDTALAIKATVEKLPVAPKAVEKIPGLRISMVSAPSG
jgi:hypothetical protein